MSNGNTFRIAVRKFGPFESAMQKIWESYCNYSGCNLAVEMVPMELDLLHQSIITKQGLKNGDWDIAHINTDWLYEAYLSDSLENLKPFINQNPPRDFPSGWSNSLLFMQQFGEEIIGLPFHDGPECLIYRKDLFEDFNNQKKYQQQYGKTLQLPETWEDFQQIAQFFYRPEENLYGTIFAGFPDGHNTVFDFCLQLWTRSGHLINEHGIVNIDTKEASEALTFYRKILSDKRSIHPQSNTFDSVQAGLAFARGEAAMMVNWFGFASMCEVYEGSQIKGKVDVTAIPKGEHGKSASLNVYWLYCVGSGSRYKQTAYDFIRFAVNPQNDKLLTMEGGIGCRISTWKDEEVNQTIPYYNKLGQLHENARSLPQKQNWATIAELLDEVVLEAINTNRPVIEILAEGQEKISRIDFEMSKS